MQNKTVVLTLTGIIGLLCLYYLSFTFVSRNYKQKATEFATDPRTGKVELAKRQRFTDSLWNEPVYLGSNRVHRETSSRPSPKTSGRPLRAKASPPFSPTRPTGASSTPGQRTTKY